MPGPDSSSLSGPDSLPAHFLRRKRPVYRPPVTEPATVIIRYPNRSRALVIVVEHPDAPTYPYEGSLRTEFSAECAACLDYHRQDADLPTVRDWASNHALDCRALPQPEPNDQ